MKNVKTVNKYLSSLMIWSVKVHNIHFNIKGKNFISLHKYLDGFYGEVLEYYDAVAELMIQQGQAPLVRVEDYLKESVVQEIEGREFFVEDLIYVKEDLMKMIQLAKEVRKEAEEEDNFLLANMMEDHVEYYTKEHWFVDSLLK